MKNEQINKLAAEAMGLCCHDPESTSEIVPMGTGGRRVRTVRCKKCGLEDPLYKEPYPNFCTDLNAAQKLFRFAYEAETGMLEMALDVTVQAELKRTGSDDVWPNNIDYVLAHPTTITLAALVSLGKLTPEQAKEILNANGV